VRSRAAVTGYVYLLMFVYAFSMTMIGPLMPELVARYSISLGAGGLLVTFMSLGGIVAMLAGGALADRASKSRLIAICFFAYALVLLLAGRGPWLPLLYALFFALGASTRYMDMVANALVADLHPERKERALSLLHAIYGLGALAGPLYARVLVDATGSWTNAYTLLGAVGIVVLALGFPLLQAPAPERSPRAGAGKALGGLLRSRDIRLLAAVLFLYVVHQSGITVWLPTYMEQEMGASRMLASAGVSLLWLGIVAGRFLTSALATRLGGRAILVWGHLAGGAALTAAVLSRSQVGLAAGVVAAGVATGAAYPLSVAIACARDPRQTAAVTSLLFVSGSLARVVFPWVAGAAAASLGLFPGMLATGLVLAAAGVLASRISRGTAAAVVAPPFAR
jgi:fucose permease